jgi:drug/metabolite transporter (DMT)-like permease
VPRAKLRFMRVDRGILAALAAALLFGASTPFAKLLLGETSPWLLAGLLYAGSGIGLAVLRRVQRAPVVTLSHNEARSFAGAVLAGGVVGPALLMWGLARMPASGAALLLNAEGVFTVLIAWFAFRENFDRRIALGMALIVVGALVLSWPGEARFGAVLPALAVLGACLAWGLDNNFTRNVSLSDATWIAMVKGLAAGVANCGLALAAGAVFPPASVALFAGVLGLFSYGISLVLFVVALRHLGAARTGAYFSIAPFAGALIAVGLGEPLTVPLLVAGALMAGGVWLHLTERHAHLHRHDATEHSHEHEHDEHHGHAHNPPIPPGTRHTHAHRHEPMVHEHAHYPDMHHTHRH